MRVIVTGGRDYTNRESVVNTLSQLDITELAHGGASGADALAAEWARSTGLKVCLYPADWITHGRAAGPIRNQWMLDDFAPDAVVAFPGKRGTAHMISIAKSAGILVIRAG
jgi:hypothetical protein